MKTLYANAKDRKLYEQLYYYYKEKIISGSFPPDTKLPSIRKCAEEFGISKTTVETAYLQLATEGFVNIRPQSGYYVNLVDYSNVHRFDGTSIISETMQDNEWQTHTDHSFFNFGLWQKYLKSVLCNSEKLIGYGHPQGEPELRHAVCEHLIKNREVYCNPEDVVIGAGTQTLLHLLYSLCGRPDHVAIIGAQFMQGTAILEDHGANVFHYAQLPDNLEVLKENQIKLIYLFPSHLNHDSPLPIADRVRLLHYAYEESVTIVEDDYDSELMTGPIAPSLQGLDGGKNVIYLGTFSKLLLPGIRISFMVLPSHLSSIYKERMHLYNQTASKLEQLALSAFIKDGRLEQQIRKTKRRKKSQ